MPDSGWCVQTIASHNDEFIFLCKLVAGDIGVSGDYLLLWCESVIFLEIEISQGSGEGKISCAV